MGSGINAQGNHKDQNVDQQKHKDEAIEASILEIDGRKRYIEPYGTNDKGDQQTDQDARHGAFCMSVRHKKLLSFGRGIK
jgi:hypothetical protein